jgi:hypothetical protein
MWRHNFLAAAVVGALAAPAGCFGQNVYPPPGDAPSAQPMPGAARLDQLVAPVALYPDDVLAQIFVASGFPVQVVQADRWISQPDNATLTNGALAAAVAGQGWDASVQALIPFPQVLQVMDQHLDWTQQLGEEFIAHPQDVMNAVQRLRHRAQQAGTLQVSPEQSVVDEGGDVTISPTNGQEIYIPNYDPECVYGPWPYPAPGPVDFGPWSGVCNAAGDTLAYGDGSYLPFGFFLWGDFDWRHHGIRIDRERYALAQPGRWQNGEYWHHESAPWHGAAANSAWHGQGYGGFVRSGVPVQHYGPGLVRPAGSPAGFGRPGVAMPRPPAVVAHPAPVAAARGGIRR